jgi:hypothetical protein
MQGYIANILYLTVQGTVTTTFILYHTVQRTVTIQGYIARTPYHTVNILYSCKYRVRYSYKYRDT